jgi:hypothetical protein
LLLKQCALYVQRYVLSDPLFPLTEQETAHGRAMLTVKLKHLRRGYSGERRDLDCYSSCDHRDRWQLLAWAGNCCGRCL